MTGEVFLSIAAPAYNERENIANMVTCWLGLLKRESLEGEVVIGEDGSTDGTKGILRELQEENDNLVVVDHPVNRGYGHALSSAIARSRGKFSGKAFRKALDGRGNRWYLMKITVQTGGNTWTSH